MKAFILAGGLGTRLRPQFGDLPKALAPLGGQPFITHQFGWLARHGVRDVVVCAGHGADALRATLGDGHAWGVRLAYSIEPEPLGTGGALRLAARHVDGPALVLNGDTLLDCDPWALEYARWSSAALGAVALFRVADAASRGRVECDATGRILRFVEKDAAHVGPAWVNGGMMALSSHLWRRLPERDAFSLEHDVLPALAEEGVLRGNVVDGEFFDIGTPEEWQRAERRFSA